MSDDAELIERVAEAMFHVVEADLLPSDIHSRFGPQFTAHARFAVAAVRAYDREQRAKSDAALAPKSSIVDPETGLITPPWRQFFTQPNVYHQQAPSSIALSADVTDWTPPVDAGSFVVVDPDDYRDPFAMVTRMSGGPGIKDG